MKPPLRWLPLVLLLLVPLRAAEPPGKIPADPVLAALVAADDERVAATRAADPARLDAIFSDGLRYAHSSGHVDSKASYVATLVSHSTVYETYDYQDRAFMSVAPGVALMTGRVLIHARNGEQKLALDLNFLAVWREEHGRWRFLAWQSCRNPPPVPK